MSLTPLGSRPRRAVIGPENAADLGRTIRALRVARGMTQSDVAGTQLTKALISQVEHGHTRPSAATLDLIARRLGTSADALLASIPGRESPHSRGVSPAYALRRVEALITVGQFDDADRQLAAYRAAPLSLGLAATAARLCAELSLRRGEVTAALDLAAEAKAAAETAGDPQEAALSANIAGRAHYQVERFAAALEYFETAIVAARAMTAPDSRLMARLLTNRGNSHWRLGDAAHARADFEGALRASEDAEDLRQLGIAHMGLGEMAREQGDLVIAVRHIERAISLFERVEERRLVVQNLHNLGEATAAAGDAAAARVLHDRALEAATALGDERTTGYALERLAVLDLDAGDTAAALRRARQAIVIGRSSGDTHLLSQSLAALGDVLDARGNSRAADRAYAEAVDAGRRDGLYSLRRTLLRRGDLERRRGDLGAAATTFESAARISPGR